MNYFENESEVDAIGDIQVENRIDRISFIGDIDITADEKGLILCRSLIEKLGLIEAILKNKRDTGILPKEIKVLETKDAGNIFGMPEKSGI